MTAFAKAESDFEACVERIQKRDGSTRINAILKATTEHGDLWTAYGEAGRHHVAKTDQVPVETKVTKALGSMKKMDDQIADLVREKQRPGESFAKAYDRVLREQPEIYTGRRALKNALDAA
ncbi:hypothetical protein [Mesorhizobium huakuii]|uniref:Uncharacterized protein n=1 Tax=Mesorhizobium huakuii TaxID=28104 RepID=A0A7G6STN7_9HYPH|nr:hypothetical protein [Mesorhizobium huakuii]QND57869.1 hypothetical protein HB778_15625 [Mesorhizobium huakuii]